MNPIVRTCVIIILFLVGMTVSLHAQGSVEYSVGSESLFQDGVTLFEMQKYQEAIQVFDSLLQDYPKSHRITATRVMKAKALLMMNEILAAAQTVKSFLAMYPSSGYVADAECTLGLINYRLQRYDDAMRSFVSAWRKASIPPRSERLLREIMDAMDATIDGHLQPAAVQRLLSETLHRPERAYFWLKLGQKEAARGNITGAAIAVDTLTLHYPENEYSDQLAALRQQIERRGAVKLGALLPLMQNAGSSLARQIGTEIYEGIQFAVEENAQQAEARVQVTLEVRDTERDPLVAMRGAQELTADDNVLAIIGPVFSNTTAAVTSLTNRRGIPLITPTANSNGIAGAGIYVFQANPDYDERGRAMARYAVGTRGFQTFAILAPSEGVGRSMADAFVDETTRLGGKIVATEWYQRGATDLQEQLSNIRKAGVREATDPLISFSGKLNRSDIMKLVQLGVPIKKIDSLVEKTASVQASALLGPRAKQMIDSLGIHALYSTSTADSLAYALSTIDAIYVPISSSDEIGVVSAQLVYYNLRSQVLGGGEWNDLAELNAQRRYCSDVIFESDSYLDDHSQLYTGFVNRFSERYNKSPTKFTLYGYDTAELIIRLIQSGGTSRESLLQGLTDTREYQGLHSKIGFVPKRVNPWVYILQYKGEGIEKIAEVNVQ